MAEKNDEAENMALIAEAIVEAEREIVKGTELLVRNANEGIAKYIEEGDTNFGEVKRHRY